LCPIGAKRSNSTFLLENPDAKFCGGWRLAHRNLVRGSEGYAPLRARSHETYGSAWETGILQAVTPTRTTIPTTT
jgi:hypothetical protein